ncbi:hypothetical protein C8Q77DRAFT_409303 [Trametes polyzona]|nr:hypothetical protein C8Q77DRAFT_409303 [Trametes polyzona]
MSLSSPHCFSIWAPCIHDISIPSTRSAPLHFLAAHHRHQRISYLFSLLSAHHQVSGRYASLPLEPGSLVLSPTYGAVYQHLPHVDGSACSLFDIAASTLLGLVHVQHLSRTFTFRTLMRRLTSALSLLPSPFFWPFHVTSVLLLLLHCSPTQTHKNIRKTPENPTHRIPPSVVSCPVSLFVVSFTIRAPSFVRTYAACRPSEGRHARRTYILSTNPPRTALPCVSARRSHLAFPLAPPARTSRRRPVAPLRPHPSLLP